MPSRPSRLRRLAMFAFLLIPILASPPSAQARMPEDANRQEPSWAEAEPLPLQDSYGRRGMAPRALLQEGAEPLLFDDSLLREIDIQLDSPDWLSALDCARPGRPGMGSETPRVDLPVSLTVDGERLEQVGLRCKGNSSLGIQSDKKPLNLTLDAFVPGQALWGHDIINLNNGFADPTLLREAIGYRMFRDYMPVPRFGFARVTINGEYLGLYITAEQISGEWADHWFPDDDGTVIKGDSPIRIALNSSELTWEGEGLDFYKRNYEVKGRNADSDEGYVALREMIRALDAPTSEGGLSEVDFPAGIWRSLDVDAALWYLAGNNLITNFDSYYAGHNYYMYLGRRDPRFTMVSWDLNLSFGLFGLRAGGGPGGAPGGNTPSAEIDPFALDTDSSRPLIRRLLAVPDYRADYAAHYRSLLEAVWTRDWVGEVGHGYQDLIDEAARDEAAAQGGIAGTFTYAEFVENLERDIEIPGRRGNTTRPGILSLVEERGAFLRAHEALQAPDLQLLTQRYSPADPTAADPVSLRATFAGADAPTRVELRYRVRGGTEIRLPMQQDAEGWTATIPAQRAGRRVTYAFRAGLDGNRAAFFPEANWTYPYSYAVAGVDLPRAEPGALVINELMPANESTIADEAGEFDDWVELYNRGSAPISLGGLYLSDDPADPWAFPLPEISLAPGEQRLVWCDNDPEQGALHAPFRLDRQGEAVSLASESQILDLVEHGATDSDVSWARLPDGGEAWQTCHTPTPGATNVCGAAPAPEVGKLYLAWLGRG